MGAAEEVCLNVPSLCVEWPASGRACVVQAEDVDLVLEHQSSQVNSVDTRRAWLAAGEWLGDIAGCYGSCC